MTSNDVTQTERTTLVFHTHGGRRYHAARTCHALRSGHDMWDTDDWGGYAVREETAQQAANRGKTPCVTCKPVVVEVPLFGETFGHEPFGPYDGGMICRRCYVTETREWVDAYDMPRHRRVRDTVGWPCTSAVILGLAPHPAAGSSS